MLSNTRSNLKDWAEDWAEEIVVFLKSIFFSFPLKQNTCKTSASIFRARCIASKSCRWYLRCVNPFFRFSLTREIWLAFKIKEVSNKVRGLLLFRNSVAEIYS